MEPQNQNEPPAPNPAPQIEPASIYPNPPDPISPMAPVMPQAEAPTNSFNSSPAMPAMPQADGQPAAGPAPQAPAPTDQLYNQPAPIVGGPPPAGFFARFKLAVIAALALLVIFAGGAAAYFGYIVPNKPENIWGTSLSNMGKGYDKLSQMVTQYPSAQGSTTTGSFQASGSFAADGTINATSDGKNSSTNISFSALGIKASLDLLTIKSATGNPDIYIKLNGLSDIDKILGGSLASYGQLLKNVNGQWYVIDHSLLNQYTSSGGSSDYSFSRADVTEFMNAASAPTKQYIFTSNPNNMAFVIKQKIGKEKIDNRNTYHYKIGVNMTNLKAYDVAVCQAVAKTRLHKFLTNLSPSTSDCNNTSDINSIKDSSTADVWVDTHTKLIHKVRFTDSTSKNSYFDLNQDYQGGTKLPFSINMVSKQNQDTTNANLTLVYDTSSHILEVNGALNSTGSTKETASLKLTISPSSKAVSIQKPANAKNVLELLGALGGGTTLQ